MRNEAFINLLLAIDTNSDTMTDTELFYAAARADDLRAFAAEMSNDKMIFTEAKEIESYYATKFDFLFNVIIDRDLSEEFDTYRETSYGLWI